MKILFCQLLMQLLVFHITLDLYIYIYIYSYLCFWLFAPPCAKTQRHDKIEDEKTMCKMCCVLIIHLSCGTLVFLVFAFSSSQAKSRKRDKLPLCHMFVLRLALGRWKHDVTQISQRYNAITGLDSHYKLLFTVRNSILFIYFVGLLLLIFTLHETTANGHCGATENIDDDSARYPKYPLTFEELRYAVSVHLLQLNVKRQKF